MPLYEFECVSCPEVFEELLLSGEDETEVRCPACGSMRVRKRWSMPAAPQVRGLPLRSGCDTSLPPCSPTCCRLPNGS